MHKADLVMDFQYGSTGKGLIAGYLAKRVDYDACVCSFAPNAGHTYIDKARDIHMMTQQLPTGISGPSIRKVFIGPGSLIHVPTLLAELERYKEQFFGKQLIIHPNAAIVYDDHSDREVANGQTKMGSTAKGVGAAMIERIQRGANGRLNVAFMNEELCAMGVVATQDQYRQLMNESEQILIEGAQGYSLSMYHGFYPYTTSRDVTAWQIAADCGLPLKWANYLSVIGTLRTYPIRVNNRDGSSGPGYEDQHEITWESIGVKPELTTVTKLPRRLFTFSVQQLRDALFHNGGYWKTRLFLNFANYMEKDVLEHLMTQITSPNPLNWNPPTIEWLGHGPDDADVIPLE